MTITIDTHAAIQELEAAGAGPKLAEAIVKTVSRADTDLVTKADLRADLATLEGRLTAAGYRRAFAVAGTVIGANTAIVFGLFKVLLPD